jgi:hypothetical protein
MPPRREEMEKCAPSLLRGICLRGGEVGQGRRSAAAGRGGEARRSRGGRVGRVVQHDGRRDRAPRWQGGAGARERMASSPPRRLPRRCGADGVGGGGGARAAVAGASACVLHRVAEAHSRGRRVGVAHAGLRRGHAQDVSLLKLELL